MLKGKMSSLHVCLSNQSVSSLFLKKAIYYNITGVARVGQSPDSHCEDVSSVLSVLDMLRAQWHVFTQSTCFSFHTPIIISLLVHTCILVRSHTRASIVRLLAATSPTDLISPDSCYCYDDYRRSGSIQYFVVARCNGFKQILY
jgi:hypothetical protein